MTCSFCGKEKKDVQRMVATPDGSAVICNKVLALHERRELGELGLELGAARPGHRQDR
jgi:hypothetical protein